MAKIEDVASNADMIKIANAVRAVTRTKGKMTIPQMPERLMNIQVVVTKDVAADFSTGNSIVLGTFDSVMNHLFIVSPKTSADAVLLAKVKAELELTYSKETGELSVTYERPQLAASAVNLKIVDMLLSEQDTSAGFLVNLGVGGAIEEYDATRNYEEGEAFLYKNNFGVTLVAHSAEEFNSQHNSLIANQIWDEANLQYIDLVNLSQMVDALQESKLDKAGGTISGNLSVQGNLNVAGTTVTQDTETLLVKDNIVVTNADKADLLNLSGLAINKNANQTYGIMYDPTTDSVKLGLGTIDETGKFTFSENGNPVAVRADSSLLVDGHLIKWDATNNRFVDSGKSVDDFVLKGEIKQDYQIVTAEPEDKSQGKMIYENVSSPIVPEYDPAGTEHVYGAPQNLVDKYLNDSENWTWDDVRNLEWLGMTEDASTNFWDYVLPLDESIYDTLYSNINNPLKLKLRINGAEQEMTANFGTVSEEAGAIWTVSDEAGTYSFQIQTQPSPILYGGMSGVEEAPHIPNIVYAGTQASVEILSISSQDGTEIWKNVGKSSVFDITNLKIADGTQYNPLKQLINEGMQEKLTAGTGITIENNIISATAQETQIDNTTITKTADGKLQAVGLQDETDSKTLTAHDIWLACSIEREV